MSQALYQDNINRIKNYFKDLSFEEISHTYIVKGIKYPSVSGLIKKYYKPFDAIKISENKAAREGLDAKALRKEWKQKGDYACNVGNKAHNYGELKPYDPNLKPTTGFEIAIRNFWDSLPEHIVPVCMELRMYHKVYNYCGTSDILLFNKKDSTFIIADYKTNKNLFKNFRGQKMLGPFKKFLDNPFNKYQLQLSFYQILFEQTGFKVSKRIIVWIKNDGTYIKYDAEDYTSILIKELKNK